MPLYLVRWPTFCASIVSARNEQHLLEQLDEEADTEGVRWTVYEGPLWVNLDLPVRFEFKNDMPVSLDDVSITDFGDVGRDLELEASLGGTGTYDAMLEKVLRWAFPVLAKAVEQARENDEELDQAAAFSVLQQELVPMLQANWREQRDPKPDLSHVVNRHALREFGIAITPAIAAEALRRLSEGAPTDGQPEDQPDGA